MFSAKAVPLIPLTTVTIAEDEALAMATISSSNRFRNQVKWSVILSLWGLLALCSAVQTYLIYQQANKPLSFATALYQGFVFGLLWALVTPLIFALARRFPLQAHWQLIPRHVVVHLVASLVIGMSQRILADWLAVLAPGSWSYFTWALIARSLTLYFDYQILIYWVVLILYEVIRMQRIFQEEQVKASRLQARLVEAQLQALKTQLQPHFLFNAMHTISALVHEDPEAADRTIARLSSLLRMALDTSSSQEVPLRQELQFLEHYLAVEKVRFEDRLQIEFDIDPQALEARVPNLILQPLVENALRHGLGSRRNQGNLTIRAGVWKGRLCLRVLDDGRGLPQDPQEGIGISNTRARLEQLYGKDQQFELRPRESGGLEAVILMPFHLSPVPLTASP